MREEFLEKMSKELDDDKLYIKVFKGVLKSGVEDADTKKFIENEIERRENKFSRGYLLGYHCVLCNDGRPVLDTALFDAEVPDFVKAIEDAGFDEFVMTDQSSGLIDLMTALAMNGWEFKCLGAVYKKTANGLKRFSAITFKKA